VKSKGIHVIRNLLAVTLKGMEMGLGVNNGTYHLLQENIMVTILGILFVALILLMIEVPSLLKNKQRKELWAFSILLFLGVGLSITKSLGINLNPSDWISIVIKPLRSTMNILLK
jgi:hypothetical protein